jgi:hypothetical protein
MSFTGPSRWTEQMRQDVFRRWKDGQSATQITRHLNVGLPRDRQFTRNAIIGLVYRAGISRNAASKPAVRPRPAAVARPPKPPPRAPKPRPKAALKIPGPPPLRVVKPPPPIMDEDLPHKRPWLERGPRQCCWPIGEGADTWSCCAPTDEGDNYCPDHKRRMFTPQSPSAKRSRDRSDRFVAGRAA